MTTSQEFTIERLQQGARKAALNHLDRNPWVSVEDVIQDVLMITAPVIARIKSPFAYGYETARRLCFKINLKHRRDRTAIQEFASEAETHYDSHPDESSVQNESLATLFDLEKDVALALLMKVVMGSSYYELHEQLESMLGKRRSASYHRLKVNAGIEAIRSELCGDQT
jgi:DNA-directed RNA polymerase specialized sigma24 family protein